MESQEAMLNDIKKKVSLMYHALMGNELTKDGGLIKRIDEMEEELKTVAGKQVKMEIYQKLIWLSGGSFLAALLNYIAGKI